LEKISLEIISAVFCVFGKKAKFLLTDFQFWKSWRLFPEQKFGASHACARQAMIVLKRLPAENNSKFLEIGLIQ